MTEWEYDKMKVDMSNWLTTKKQLNEYGGQGWELCQLSDKLDENNKATGIFKKVKQQITHGHI